MSFYSQLADRCEWGRNSHDSCRNPKTLHKPDWKGEPGHHPESAILTRKQDPGHPRGGAVHRPCRQVMALIHCETDFTLNIHGRHSQLPAWINCPFCWSAILPVSITQLTPSSQTIQVDIDWGLKQIDSDSFQSSLSVVMLQRLICSGRLPIW